MRRPFFAHKQKIVELFLGFMLFRGPVHAGFVAVLALVAISASCSHHHARAILPPAPAVAGTSETGIASWYGIPYHGRQTSSGEIYDMYGLTAAHRNLPFQTWVEVENLTNGKRVDVRINDRGPFVRDRIIDLSQTAAREIEMLGPGTARVRLTVIAPSANFPPPYQPAAVSSTAGAAKVSPAAAVIREPSVSSTTSASERVPSAPVAGSSPPAMTVSRYAVQAAAFVDRDRAEMFRQRMNDAFADARTRIDTSRTPPLWRVVVGREMTKEQADDLARRVRTEAGAGIVVPEPDAILTY